jgi:hypothetical protein
VRYRPRRELEGAPVKWFYEIHDQKGELVKTEGGYATEQEAKAAGEALLGSGVGLVTAEQDRLCTECKHPNSSHRRKLGTPGTMKADPALLGHKPDDFYSGRPVGESACNMPGCGCRSYRQ